MYRSSLKSPDVDEDELNAKRRRKQQVLEMLAAESGVSSATMLEHVVTPAETETVAVISAKPVAADSTIKLGMKLSATSTKSKMAMQSSSFS